VVERGTSGDDLLFYWNTAPAQVEIGFFDTVGGTVVPAVALASLADVRVGTSILAGSVADPAVAAAGNSKVAYNTTTGTLRASINGAAFGDVVVETTASTTTVGGVTNAIATATLADNTSYFVYAYFVARRTDAPDRAAYVRQAAVYREGGGGATLQGLVSTPFTRESAVYNATFAVTGNTVEARVTGFAGHTVDWAIWLRLVSVS
jgi:hypothetical protein